jgi:phosphohistidine phosphatase
MARACMDATGRKIAASFHMPDTGSRFGGLHPAFARHTITASEDTPMPANGGSEEKDAPVTSYDLYIMRHGIAGERGPAYPDDTKRPLTPDGKQKLREAVAGLAKLGVELDWIVSSPLVRARETAEIVRDGLGANTPLDLCDALSPGGSPEALLKFLARQPKRTRVLITGHEPDLGLLAARLLGAGRHARLGFKKGGCCRIAFDEFPPQSPGQLVWWLTPKVMRKLA